MAVEIRILTPDDLSLLEHVAPEVFDNPIDLQQSAAFLADPRHHLAVAIVDDAIVGMASAVSYLHPDKPLQFWINEVGVAPTHQRKGIGRQLLAALLDVGRKLGCQEAWLGTETDNEAANKLYLAAGGEPEPFVMYSFKLSEEP